MNGNIGYRRQNSPDEKEKIVEAPVSIFTLSMMAYCLAATPSAYLLRPRHKGNPRYAA